MSTVRPSTQDPEFDVMRIHYLHCGWKLKALRNANANVRNAGVQKIAMPLPRWLARINKRVFNPLEIRRGVRPVLIHVGRSSGKTYRTPLDAHSLPGGYLFIPMYGPRTDWVKNVLVAGAARLSIAGTEIDLLSPRMVRKETIWPLLPTTTKTPPGISDDDELLRMDVRCDTS